MNELEQKNLLETEAQFSDELSAEDLDAVAGGYSWGDFRRQSGTVLSDMGKGGKDGVRGDKPRKDNLAYNTSYAVADILDN